MFIMKMYIVLKYKPNFLFNTVDKNIIDKAIKILKNVKKIFIIKIKYKIKFKMFYEWILCSS